MITGWLIRSRWRHWQERWTKDDTCRGDHGAGISTVSGLKTSCGADGLWRGYRPEEVANPEAWQRDPGLVLDFYNKRRRAIRWASPNATHPTLVDLERDYGVPTISATGAPSDARSGRISSVLGSRCPALDEASELVA